MNNTIFWLSMGVTFGAQSLIWYLRVSKGLPVNPLTMMAVLCCGTAFVGQFFCDRAEKREAGWKALAEAPSEEVRTVTLASLQVLS